MVGDKLKFPTHSNFDFCCRFFMIFKSQIKKERLSLDNLTNAKCKDILNKLGYNKYYEHISFIKDKKT